jgi:hypothetical protein
VNLRRLSGILLIFAAGAGFIFTIVGLFEVWRFRPVVTNSGLETLALFDQTLTTTQNGLDIAGQALQSTTVGVESLQTTTQALSQTISDTNPLLDSLTSLTSKDFPAALDATQTSLASAQGSALLIDNTLATLSSIPFLPMTAYKPEVPLHTALAGVSTSLDSLKPALKTITDSLTTGKTNLSGVAVEINNISETTKEISTSLASAKTIIDQYKTVTTQLKTRLEAAQLAVPGWIMSTAWILTIVLAWSLIAQLGMGIQGLNLLRDHRLGKKLWISISQSASRRLQIRKMRQYGIGIPR